MTSNMIRKLSLRTRVLPFLVRFTRERSPKDVTNRNRQQPPGTTFTAVRRETTDDR